MKRSRHPPSNAPQQLATAYFRHDGPGVWEIRGAGAMYGPLSPMNAKLRAIIDALRTDGIDVVWKTTGSPANCDEHRFSAEFEDGGLAVRTGNYWYGPRGGFVSGVDALRRLIRLLNLRVSPQTSRAWGLQMTDRGTLPSPPRLRRDGRGSRRGSSSSRRDKILDLA